MKSNPSVYIVILNWNNPHDTIECLESIASLDYVNYCVIVVDNGSTDRSVEIIRANHPTVEILELGDNLGYGGGNNAGIIFGLDRGADYILILNNDTVVAPGMLGELVKVAETDTQIGMVGPTMYCLDPPDTLFSAGSKVQWQTGDICHRGIFQPTASYPIIEYPEIMDFIVGCAVLVSRRMIDVIGLMDPLYYLNYEDVEWGIRANRYGFTVLYVPNAALWHKISATLDRDSPTNVYYLTRNALRFFWTYSPNYWRLVVVSRIILRVIRTVTAWTVKPKYREEIYQRKRSANLFALRDFFLGRYGKMGIDVERVCSITTDKKLC